MALIELGNAIAKIENQGGTDSMTVITPSQSSGDSYLSVTIYGRRALIDLRDALLNAYPCKKCECGHRRWL